MARITVTHLGADSFEITTRGHTLSTDQPSPGRVEIGPTPTELFVAGIAACAGFYAEHFLRRHGLAHRGVRVQCDWAWRSVEPSRVTRVALRVTPPEPIPESLRGGLINAVESCTVHNSLRQPPDVFIELSEPDAGQQPALAASDTGKG